MIRKETIVANFKYIPLEIMQQSQHLPNTVTAQPASSVEHDTAVWAPQPVWASLLETKILAAAGSQIPVVQQKNQSQYSQWVSYPGSDNTVFCSTNRLQI
jgi:hypothetical protein